MEKKSLHQENWSCSPTVQNLASLSKLCLDLYDSANVYCLCLALFSDELATRPGCHPVITQWQPWEAPADPWVMEEAGTENYWMDE